MEDANENLSELLAAIRREADVEKKFAMIRRLPPPQNEVDIDNFDEAFAGRSDQQQVVLKQLASKGGVVLKSSTWPKLDYTRLYPVEIVGSDDSIQEFIKSLPRPPRQRITFEVAKSERVATDSAEPLANTLISRQSREQIMSADRNDFSAEFKPQREIQIAGPNDVQLTIYPVPNRYTVALLGGSPIRPASDCYVWNIHNRALESVSNIRLEISTVRTFDERQSAFREPINLGFQWPVLKHVGAGDRIEPATFLMADGENLRLGSSDEMPILRWPNGDNSVVRCWRLSMEVTGLSQEWQIELDLRWTLGTKTLELMECSAETRICPMKTAVRIEEHDPDSHVEASRSKGHSARDGRAADFQTRARKGELTLLYDQDGTLKDSVSYDHARLYLGVSLRQVQRLVSGNKKSLTVTGRGQNKQITVASLLEYLPAKKAT